MTTHEYKVIQNCPADAFGRYERWGWSADKIGCGGGYATKEQAEAAAKAAIEEAQSKTDLAHKLYTGPFTGAELSDGFTREEDEEAALREEANNFSAA